MPLENASSQDLLFLLQDPATRREAFDQVFRKFHRRLWLTATKLTGDSHKAEDIVQGVFEKVLQLKDFSVIINLEAYLVQSCKNASLNEIDTAKSKTEGKERYRRHFTPLAQMPNPIWLDIYPHLAALPRQQQHAFRFVYIEGHDIRTAASLMRITLPTLKMHLQLAKKYLRQKFIQLKIYP